MPSSLPAVRACRCPHTTTNGVTHPGTNRRAPTQADGPGTPPRRNVSTPGRAPPEIRSYLSVRGLAMGRTALRRATVALTAALVLTVTFSPVAHAADTGLTAAMLDTGDLPAGFAPDASLTGPLTAQRARDLGLNPGQRWSRDTSVRTWLAPGGAGGVQGA